MAAERKTYASTGKSSAPAGVDSLQWESNPYAQFDYTHTWWQKLWEGLGFRSKFDEYRDSMAANAREYEAQLAEKAHNEAYDSASAQVARERAAGINPDLAGNVDAGSSSGMQPDPNGPISPGHDDPVQIVSGFANTVMSCLNGAIGFAKAGLDLSNMRNAVESGKIGNAGQSLDLAMKLARQYVPGNIPDDTNSGDWKEQSIDLAMQSAGLHLSRTQQKAVRQHMRGIYNSAPGKAEQWSSWIDMMDNTIAGNMKRSSKFWGDGTDEVIMDVVQPIVEVTDRLMQLKPDTEEAQLRAQQSEAGYTEEYFDSADGKLAGEVFNATNERNLNSAKIDTYLNEALEQIIHNLKDRSESNKSGHGLAAAAILFFSVMRMMNFSGSVSPKGISAGIGF